MLCLLLAGCASSEPVQVRYDVARNRSTFESARSTVGLLDMSQGLAGGQRVMWQAVASCTGPSCSPQEVELIFFNESDGELNVDTRRLQLVFDGTSQEWEDLSRVDEPGYYRVAQGEFFRVVLPALTFARLAKAGRVDVLFGRSGTRAITVPFERRAVFRACAGELGLEG